MRHSDQTSVHRFAQFIAPHLNSAITTNKMMQNEKVQSMNVHVVHCQDKDLIVKASGKFREAIFY